MTASSDGAMFRRYPPDTVPEVISWKLTLNNVVLLLVCTVYCVLCLVAGLDLQTAATIVLPNFRHTFHVYRNAAE